MKKQELNQLTLTYLEINKLTLLVTNLLDNFKKF